MGELNELIYISRRLPWLPWENGCRSRGRGASEEVFEIIFQVKKCRGFYNHFFIFIAVVLLKMFAIIIEMSNGVDVCPLKC